MSSPLQEGFMNSRVAERLLGRQVDRRGSPSRQSRAMRELPQSGQMLEYGDFQFGRRLFHRVTLKVR
jgi:hypothetical protein